MLSKWERFLWAVGLFEGEGSIVHSPQADGRIQRRLSLTSTDEDVVRTFHSVVGVGNVTGPYQRGTREQAWKPQWTWNACKWEQIQFLLGAMEPYLHGRRRMAARALLSDPAKPVGGPRKERCKRGHLLADAYIAPNGNRHCRACRKVRAAA